jgi:catechol 2,3-dioxygenase
MALRDPEELEAEGAPVAAEIAGATRMGAVHLTVADLDRSIAYYGSAIGLRVHAHEGATAALGAGGEDLLVLTEAPGARPVRANTGLYHFALLLPQRVHLARFLAHVARERVPLAGLSDHAVSEAIYLRDPDEHGIEVYWDRPRALWEGHVAEQMTTIALDVDGLLRELDDPATEPFEGLAPGATMGHVHLRVADVGSTVAFYRDVLGFGLMAQLGRQAAFLAAGGYHHHVGANTWESAGAPPAPAGSATLQRMTIVLPDGAALDAVAQRAEEAGVSAERAGGAVHLRDPSGNPVALTTA